MPYYCSGSSHPAGSRNATGLPHPAAWSIQPHDVRSKLARLQKELVDSVLVVTITEFSPDSITDKTPGPAGVLLGLSQVIFERNPQHYALLQGSGQRDLATTNPARCKYGSKS
jgi:hypothetical protein